MATWPGELLSSGVGHAVAWYLAMLLVTAVGVVPAATLFSGLASRGLHVARPLGLALVALLTWLIVHLTPLPYGTAAVVSSLGLIALVSLAAGIVWPQIPRSLLARWREFAAVEALAAALFIVVLLVRMQAPDAWGTEKPADLMLMTAVHRTQEFPPLDPWAAGERVSYYHLGQVQMDHPQRPSTSRPRPWVRWLPPPLPGWRWTSCGWTRCRVRAPCDADC